jgi:hypothetical protein
MLKVTEKQPKAAQKSGKVEKKLRLSPFTFANICAIFVFSWLDPKTNQKTIFSQFQNKGQLIFEDKWPSMEPVVQKLLHQDHVDNS